jgi:hypothetical protein
MVELQLLHPCEPATGDHAPGQRVELAGVLVPQAEQTVGAVDVVGDHGRQAEVGQLQLGLELRIAHERGDAVGRSREVVVTLELHGVSLAAAPVVARLSVSRRLTRPVARVAVVGKDLRLRRGEDQKVEDRIVNGNPVA